MNQRKKIVTKLLNQAKKLGLNMDKVTEGKSLDTLSHTQKTIENLKKRFKRQKEQPKIKAEVKKIDRRLERKKQQIEEDKKIEERRRIKRGIITDESKAEIKWNGNTPLDKINNELLKDKTEKALDDFFNRYFKDIKHEYQMQKKLKEIKSRFGVRLDLAYKFMEYLGKQNFKYEIEKELMKSDIPQAYTKMLRDRLDTFIGYIGKEFDL